MSYAVPIALLALGVFAIVAATLRHKYSLIVARTCTLVGALVVLNCVAYRQGVQIGSQATMRVLEQSPSQSVVDVVVFSSSPPVSWEIIGWLAMLIGLTIQLIAAQANGTASK